jgi:hypothetical protein
MSAFDADDQEALLGLAKLDADAAPGLDDAGLEELLQRTLRSTADADPGLLPAGVSDDAPFGAADGAGDPGGWPSAREDGELDAPARPADADEPPLEDGPAAGADWDAGGDVDPGEGAPGGDQPWSIDP